MTEFRQEMFAIRDEMFDYAESRSISFDDPAYRLLRQLMNGFIRYAHRITFFRLVMSGFHKQALRPSTVPDWHKNWEAAVCKLKNEEVRQRLNEFHERIADLVAVRVVTGSPLLFLCLLSAVSALVIRERILNLHKLFANLQKYFEDAASTTVSRLVDTERLENAAAAA